MKKTITTILIAGFIGLNAADQNIDQLVQPKLLELIRENEEEPITQEIWSELPKTATPENPYRFVAIQDQEDPTKFLYLFDYDTFKSWYSTENPTNPLTRRHIKTIRVYEITNPKNIQPMYNQELSNLIVNQPSATTFETQQQRQNRRLLDAAFLGDTQEVQASLQAGADVNARDNSEATALMWAAQNGHTATAEALLAAGAEVNARNNSEATALMWAAKNGHTAIAEALLAAGAEVNARDYWGATALMWAAQTGHTAIVEALLAAGADVNAENYDRYTALDIAKLFHYQNVVDILEPLTQSYWVRTLTQQKYLIPALALLAYAAHRATS